MEHLHPIAFPGTMFNAEGISLDATMPDLTQDKLDAYPHPPPPGPM